MSHNVPNWNLDNGSIPASRRLTAANSSDVDPFTLAELSWENGQLSVNGLGPGGLTRVSNQRNLNFPSAVKEAWESSRAAVGTLESIVNLATQKQVQPPLGRGDFDDIEVPWLDCGSQGGSSAAASVTDALVPCGTPNEEEQQQGTSKITPTLGINTCVVEGSTRVEKDRPATRVPVEGEWSIQHSLSMSTLAGIAFDTCEKDSGRFGVATASFCSQGRTLSLSTLEKPASTNNTTPHDDHDSICLTRSQGNTSDKEDKKNGEAARSSLSTKRSRAAAIHNQSERKRRDTINQKMKMLQKMVPNSSKTDKASMLDEVIDYLKQLQAQVHMMTMSRMSIPSMMMPFAIPHAQHPLHMTMMHPPMGMGMDMNMNIINPIMACQNLANLSPLINPSAAFMPMAPWDVAPDRSASSTSLGSIDPSRYLAPCQTQMQPMSMEAYTRMIFLIQQQHQRHQQHSASVKN